MFTEKRLIQTVVTVVYCEKCGATLKIYDETEMKRLNKIEDKND